MPRLRALILFAAFYHSPHLPCLADDKAKPSPVVRKILDKAVGEVRKNRQAFDKANEKPIAEARQELQDLATNLIKDGRTDEATAVLGQVKTLEADVMKSAGGAVGGKVAPEKTLLERLVGKWRRDESRTIQIQGKTIKQSDGHEGSLVASSCDVATATLAGGWRWHIQFVNEDLVAVREWDPKGQMTDGMVLERIR